MRQPIGHVATIYIPPDRIWKMKNEKKYEIVFVVRLLGIVLLENHVHEWANCGHTEHIVQQRYMHQQMQIFRMNSMLCCILWVDIVSDEIQRCHHKIVHANLQVVDIGQRQKSIIHRIDQNEYDNDGQRTNGECEHAQIEIIEKCDSFRAKSTQHPEEYDWHAEE